MTDILKLAREANAFSEKEYQRLWNSDENDHPTWQQLRDKKLADLVRADYLAELLGASVEAGTFFTKEHVSYINRYGGNCRDCADENGVCPNSGLPCGGQTRAIEHVLEALSYGVQHKYLPPLYIDEALAAKVAQMQGEIERLKDQLEKCEAIFSEYKSPDNNDLTTELDKSILKEIIK